MNRHSRGAGLFFVMSGAAFWGISGTVSQKLFQQCNVDVNWLVAVRLLTGGLLLLTVQFFKSGTSQIIDIWRHKNTALKLLIYGIFGMLAVQYTYLESINHGNSAVATLLQYLYPVVIIIYTVLRKQDTLTIKNLFSTAFALVGCFFLLTNGTVQQLSVPTPAIFWGLMSALAAAFYTVYAVQLLKQYDSLVILGWAMVIGGTAFSIVKQPWKISVIFTPDMYLYLIFVIIFGTVLGFWFYIESLNSLTPTETSLLSSIEPLSAVITTVFWLKEPFGVYQWVGTSCIIAMIGILALPDKAEVKKI